MRKTLFMLTLLTLVVAVPLFAQEATPEPTQDMMATPEMGGDMGTMMTDPAVQVTNQVVLNGMVSITRIDSEGPGFVAIHADMNGQPGHVVGVAPIAEGGTDNLAVMIDGAMATPVLHAMLHVDDNTPGVFEYELNPAADMPRTGSYTSFTIAGIFAYDQQPIENTVILASVITQDSGWLVVHADNNGQPGPVLGQALLNSGTNPAVIVPLAAEGQTPVLWPMLHVDDNTVGTHEFGQVEGADAPVVIEGQVATRPMNATETPTVMLADGTMLENVNTPIIIPAMNQMLDTTSPGGTGQLTIDNVVSIGAGFIDVHSDMMGHPSASIGVTPVADGENTGVVVPLAPPPAMPDMLISPMVWPMLHADTNSNGIYEYLKVVGADLPVIYNGAVVTVPTMVGAAAGGDSGMGGMATDEAGMIATADPSLMATPEVTPAG